MSVEFVIAGKQRAVVEENVNRIKQLFGVQISIANGTPETVWITLKGGRVENAKTYIQALTNPEGKNRVTIPASLIKTLGPRSTEHSNLESEYGVIVSFPQETTACISGSAMNVMLAMSKLEDLIKKHTKPAQPKTNRPLEDFALKLGYDQEQINMVFDKLGPTVDKNTFLNQLINVSGAGTRAADDRWSPASSRSASTSRQNQFVANGVYDGDTGVVSRGVIPRSSVNAPPSNGPQGYHAPIGNVINPYNRNLGALPAHGDDVLARGFLPRTTGPSTPGINVNSSGVVARGIMPRTTAPSTQGNSLTSSNASSGAYIPRTTPQTSQGSNSTYSTGNSNWSNSSYLSQGSDYDDTMFIQMVSRYQELPQSDLRPIVIDGSNVAMSHGNNKVFSCRGILLCVEWFRQKGHKQITVFVPSWRKESSKIDNPITDQHILYQLEEQGCLTFTPSRKVNGRRIVCYDDRYLIRLAESTNGIVVSNDNFKDLASENPKWRDVIEQRLLMYSFVNDMFMPPDDPLGRHGPTLDEFLHKGTQTHRRVCPYGRRCTYGTRCKYHHPEREDTRLPIYLNLKMLFPNQENIILNVMKKYPQEKDADKLASYVLSMMQ